MAVYYNEDTKTFIESDLLESELLNYEYRRISITEIGLGNFEYRSTSRRLSLLTYSHPCMIDTKVEIITDTHLSADLYKNYSKKKFYHEYSSIPVESIDEIVNYFEYLKNVVHLSKLTYEYVSKYNGPEVWDILKNGGDLKMGGIYFANFTVGPNLTYLLPFLSYFCIRLKEYTLDDYLCDCGYTRNKMIKEEEDRKRKRELTRSYFYESIKSNISYEDYMKMHMPKVERKIEPQDIEFTIPLYRLYTSIGTNSLATFFRYGCDTKIYGKMCEEYVPFISSLSGLNLLDVPKYRFDEDAMYKKARGEQFIIEQRYKEYLNRCKEKNNRKRGYFIDYIFSIRDEKKVLTPELFKLNDDSYYNKKPISVKVKRKTK